MIIVNIQGGLGNQMFQYASAKALAKRNNFELLLNVKDWYGLGDGPVKRNFELDKLSFDYKYANWFQVLMLRGFSTFRILRFAIRILNKIIRKFNKNFSGIIWKSFILQSNFRNISEFVNLKGSYYLEGWWQSEKYFIDIKDEIIRDFQVKEIVSEEDSNIINAMQNSNSVSIHIRRGDYLKIPSMQGTCDIDYYKNSIKYIAEHIDNPVLYFFSDDIDWVKENLKFDLPTFYMEPRKVKADWLDLRLMTKCKHNIIANSSFSWWGAWLNANPEKIVIAPKQWVLIPNPDTNDIVPDAWIRI